MDASGLADVYDWLHAAAGRWWESLLVKEFFEAQHTAHLRRELAGLLAEGIAGAKKREREAFDQLAGRGDASMVLFGAGGLGRRTVSGLRKHGIAPLAFADNRHDTWGSRIEGVPVLAPDDAARRFGRTAAFVVTIWGALGKDRMRDRIRS